MEKYYTTICIHIFESNLIWHNVCVIFPQGWITFQGYMCQWALLTLTNVRKTLEYMAYLGYNMYHNECQTSSIVITREKKIDLAKKQSSRNVYTCHVIGPKSSGKTTLCRTLIDPKLEVNH